MSLYSSLPESLQTVGRWVMGLLGFGLCIGAAAIVYFFAQMFFEADTDLGNFLASVLPFGVFALVFLVMGILLIRSAFKGNTSQRAYEEAEARPEPWTAREEWGANKITHTSRVRRSRVFAIAIVFLFFVGGAGSMAVWAIWSEILTASSPEWSVLFAAILPIVGLPFGLYLARQEWTLYQRGKRFGTSKATLETMPGRIGQRIVAQVQAAIDRSEFPGHGAQVQLSCYQRTARYKSSGKNSRKLKEHYHLLWRAEKQMQAARFNANGAQIPASFQIPDEMPRSTAIKRSKQQLARTGESDIVWEIKVRAEMPGVDYESRFEVPVYEPEEAPSEDYTPDASKQSDGQPEQVLWNLDTDQEALQIGQKDESSSQDPYAGHVVEPSLTGPISKNISMEQVGGQGVRIRQEPERSLKGMGLSMLWAVLGLGFILAIPIVLLTVDLSQFGMFDNLLGFTVILGLGLVFCQAAWTTWAQQKTITVSNGEVDVKVKGGSGKSERFPVTEVENVDVRISGSRSNASKYPQSDYQVVILKRGAAKETDSVASGIADTLGQVFGQKNSRTMKGSIPQNHAAPLDNLQNKQEADWLAQQLRDAVQAEQRYA